MPDASGQKLVDLLATLACLGTLVTGVAGFIVAANLSDRGAYTGVGLCLVASALAFGMLLNALWRK